MASEAEIKLMFADLSGEFGMKLLERKASKKQLEQIKEWVGTYSKGKNEGKLKGKLVWLKCVKGGWDFEYGNKVCGVGSFGYRILGDGAYSDWKSATPLGLDND